MSPELWNLLHDGDILRIDGVVPGDVKLIVGMDYLNALFSPAGTAFVVRIRGASRFEFCPYDWTEAPMISLKEIEAEKLEILSATLGENVEICCESGMLTLSYDDAEIALENGQPIAMAELARAAEQYWTDWELRKGKPHSSPPGA